jgi:hypothetical protein
MSPAIIGIVSSSTTHGVCTIQTEHCIPECSEAYHTKSKSFGIDRCWESSEPEPTSFILLPTENCRTGLLQAAYVLLGQSHLHFEN